MKPKAQSRKPARKSKTARRRPAKITLSSRVLSFFKGGRVLVGKFTSALF